MFTGTFYIRRPLPTSSTRGSAISWWRTHVTWSNWTNKTSATVVTRFFACHSLVAGTRLIVKTMGTKFVIRIYVWSRWSVITFPFTALHFLLNKLYVLCALSCLKFVSFVSVTSEDWPRGCTFRRNAINAQCNTLRHLATATWLFSARIGCCVKCLAW
jgi:hypothetical protein